MEPTRTRAALVGVVLLTTIGAILTTTYPSTAHPGDPRVRGDVSAPRHKPRPQLLLTLDGGKQRAGDALRRLRNQGRAAVDVSVVRRDGGRAIRTGGPYAGWALRMPALAAGDNPPRAAIRVLNNGSGDPLSPLARAFAFGADFRLDSDSAGVAKDNGDNLVQRGHHNSAAQYKLQLDRGRVMCRVKGTDGAVTVRSRPVRRHAWYRARCRRAGPVVELRVWRLARNGPSFVAANSRRGATGAVRLARGVPLSVAGKLAANGRLPAAGNDQFNGVVDRIVYRVRS